MPGFHHGIRISHSRFLSGDSVFHVSNSVTKMHNLFGGRPPVEHAEHGLSGRLVLLGLHHALLDMLRRGTSQDIALEIRRGENVSRGSRLHLTGGLLRRRPLLLVGKCWWGLVLGEHVFVRTIEVLQEGIASGVHVGVEGDLLLRRILEGGVLRKLLKLRLCLGTHAKKIRKLGREDETGAWKGEGGKRTCGLD